MTGPAAFVFESVDVPEKLLRWPPRLVDFKAFQQSLNDAQLVARINDLKSRGQLGLERVTPQ